MGTKSAPDLPIPEPSAVKSPFYLLCDATLPSGLAASPSTITGRGAFFAIYRPSDKAAQTPPPGTRLAPADAIFP